MHTKRLFRILIALGLMLAAWTASAGTAVTISSVNLRAGPATNYPVVITMPVSASIVTYGCTPDMLWCDVGWNGQRGWVSASYIRVMYQQTAVAVTVASAPTIGISIVHFDHDYWHRYYVGRPWYPNWSHYEGPSVVHRGATACNGNGCAHVGKTVVRPANEVYRSTTTRCSDRGCVRVDRGR